MEGFVLIKQGAEARLYKGNYLGKSAIAKERFTKKYRHRTLDNLLTKERIKAECRAIVRCKSAGIKTPTIYLTDFKRGIIFMEYFEHSLIAKDFIEKSLSSDILDNFGLQLGNLLGRLHEKNIVHGDLTSSNILLINKMGIEDFSNLDDMNIALIDFGLAQLEASPEDKGVDLYVLERALISTHSVADKLFRKILEGYKKTYGNGNKEVLSKYAEVRARGRKRTMVG